jgi:hypothetical protein
MERTAPQQKTPAQLVAEQRNVENWLKYYVNQSGAEFEGYVDFGPQGEVNRDVLFNFIYANLDGWITMPNLRKAASACHLQIHGLGVHHAESIARKKAAAAQAVIDQKRALIAAETNRVVEEWTKNTCPRCLITNGDIYPANVSAIIAFLRERDPRMETGDISPTAAQLNEAVETLWDGGLAKFSSKPEDLLFRNIPVVEKKMSQRARDEAGLVPVRLKGHSDDKPMVSMEDTAKLAKKIFDKLHGGDPEAMAWRQKREALIVQGRMGRMRFDLTEEMRKIIIKDKSGKVDEKATFLAQDAFATQAEKAAKK